MVCQLRRTEAIGHILEKYDLMISIFPFQGKYVLWYNIRFISQVKVFTWNSVMLHGLGALEVVRYITDKKYDALVKDIPLLYVSFNI